MSARIVLSLALLISQSGCTYMLWTDDNLQANRVPAGNADLRLYASKTQDDFLVVYQEQSERNNKIRTRAYWLLDNENRVKAERAPLFASKKSQRGLSTVPLYYLPPVQVETNHDFYAVWETNNESFAIFTTNRAIGIYTLPIYDDGRGRLEKIALTPVAVSVDAAVGVVILGILILGSSADDDSPNFPEKHEHHDNSGHHS